MNQKRSVLSQHLYEFWRYRDLLKLLISKNIKLKYRRSVLGYLWSVLEPLMLMVVMSIVFSTMFKRDIENFPVYLFCGLLLFNFMNKSTQQSITAITSNASLLMKAYVPKYIFALARVTSGFVDLCLSLGALVLVLLVTHAKITWHALLVPFVLLQLYVFCIGLSLFLAQANVFFRDTQFIYNAATRAWMYLTAIFYPLDALPKELSFLILRFNPMYFYIGQFRDLIYHCRMPEPIMVMEGCGAAVLALCIGAFAFVRVEDKFILHI